MNETSLRVELMMRRDLLRERQREELDRAGEQQTLHEIETVEHAAEQWDASVLSSLGEVDGRAIGEVVAAIDRLDAGVYGACVHCGGAITESRLAALPTAALCIDCARHIADA
jgi:RNA polymerase-binding transcription factor DksA